jgi:glycine/D-amino acid oxidase-like deaminating enzyme
VESQVYDWIVVGNGFAGAALSYELARLGGSVLVIEQEEMAQNATRYSYGGISYWSAKTPLMQQVFLEGWERHHQLSEELGQDTEFRERDLLLLVSPEEDIGAIAQTYEGMLQPPTWIDAATAQQMEPLLEGGAIAGAFTVRHGQVNPLAMVRAYNQAFLRLGGTLIHAQVTGFCQTGDRITGVQTPTQRYGAQRVVVCAGGLTRALLHTAGIRVPCYYTQAELIETPPVDFTLQTLIMPARMQRFELEAIAGKPETDALWDAPGQELLPPVLDPGVFQFGDRHLCIGQISRTHTRTHPPIDPSGSEAQIRAAMGRYIPALKAVPGTWHQCLVAFTRDSLPLVGALPERDGLLICSGFSGPFALLPPLARRFAQAQFQASPAADPILSQCLPTRFAQTQQIAS